MARNPDTFRAACVQMRSGLDREKNTNDALELIVRAAAEGAHFVATPEMTNVVDQSAARLFAGLPDEAGLFEIAAFSGAAKAHKIWLLIGSMAVKVEGARAANRAFLFAPDGSIAARYDKLHMFDVDLPGGESWKESSVFAPGDKAVLVQTPLANMGLTICYDLRFPTLFRALSRAGAQVVCVPAAFTRQTGKAHWKTLLTARAIECGVFIIAPAQGGAHEDERETYGHSLIIDPWGNILAERENADPGVILADIKIAKAHEVRQRIPNLALEQTYKVLTLTP